MSGKLHGNIARPFSRSLNRLLDDLLDRVPVYSAAAEALGVNPATLRGWALRRSASPFYARKLRAALKTWHANNPTPEPTPEPEPEPEAPTPSLGTNQVASRLDRIEAKIDALLEAWS